MAITLFDRRNLAGTSLNVNGNRTDLRNSAVAYSTTSIRMTAGADRVLFFTRRNWDGNVMFRRGVNTINHVGRPRQGGRTGFNNSIRSLRTTNFRMDVIYHVIRDGNGNFPGGFANRPAMNAFIAGIHATADTIWRRAFIRLNNRRTNIHDSDRFFNMRGEFLRLLMNRSFSTPRSAINVFLVNSIRGNTLGRAAGKRVSTKTIVSTGGVAGTARTLAHEIGHILSLGHGANNNPARLMSQTRIGTGTTITQDQVQRVHRRLSIRRGELRDLRRE